MEFSHGPADGLKVTLVGKGVCYDTGGLDIKPSSAMALMKKDMGGAAVTLALADMLLSADLPLRCASFCPSSRIRSPRPLFARATFTRAAKGSPSRSATRTRRGGSFSPTRWRSPSEDEPDLLFDFATLTGAARVALGPEIPPFYTRSDALAEEIARSGAAANDPVWRLPLWEDYQSGLDSKIADVSSTTSHGFAGSITAALFLEPFRRESRALGAFRRLLLEPFDQARPSRRRRDPGRALALRSHRDAARRGSARRDDPKLRQAADARSPRSCGEASRRPRRRRALRRRRRDAGQRGRRRREARAASRRAARHSGDLRRLRDRL